MQGMSLSIMARGPCFNSPLRMPSECMYVSSLIFCEGGEGRGGEGREDTSYMYLMNVYVRVYKDVIPNKHTCTHVLYL